MFLFLMLNTTILKILSFKKRILAFIGPFANNTFQYHNPKGLKLIARLRLGLSHLRFHQFKHIFQDTLNPICNCGTVEATVHYLLNCLNFSNERLIFFNKLQSIDANILSKDDSTFKSASLWQFNDEKNTSILTASIEYIISTKRFDAPLFQNWHIYLSMSSLSFVFVMKLSVNLFCFTFTIVRTAIFRLFCKMIYFVRFFFLYLFIFHDYYVCFINPQKFAPNLTIE